MLLDTNHESSVQIGVATLPGYLRQSYETIAGAPDECV